MTERTTVRLPPDLVRRAKHRAAERGCSLTALIEEGLRRVVDESREISSSVRSLPRVSAARGGLRPEIDLEDSTLLEVDDIEYVRRFF